MEISLEKRLLQRVQGLQREKLPGFHIVMLPDFFVDHFVYFDSVDTTCQEIQKIAAQGGGNRPGITQRLQQGGNATNTALGLARLGMSTHLICQTSPLGLYLLQYFLGNNGVGLSGVHTDGGLALTTAFEFQKPQANIMLGDPGSVASFSHDLLNAHDWELITSAALVGVVNWNQNRLGTDLACRVFEQAKKQGSKTFFDTGDPSPRLQDISQMMEKVLMNHHLDRFGLNENELRLYSQRPCRNQEEMLAALEELKKRIPARIDFHTAVFSASAQEVVTVVPTIRFPMLYRSTGAGDIWNAANIFADLLEFDADERLLFANVVAGLYISSPDPFPPTFDMVINFIKNNI
ncbi:MAG: carbohydrate kinase family protein [Candidatus Thermoplasmatota archaeon]|jgi:sugar/nucleoside kinase (ribokinase family)|nr:carbohydrate kinase family protein [Candidatus Thermoplasmatota archaeon]